MRRALLAVALVGACDQHSAAPAPPATPPTAVASPSASAFPLSAGLSAGLSASTPCGDLACRQFDSPREALLVAIAGDAQVVAFGEAHAPRGATVPSAAARFTAEFLPLFAGRASDLLVELMMPPQGCADAATEVRQKQAPATTPQAPTNQNEYLAMGDRARALGIVPDLLRPSCADLEQVRSAGDGAIEASLELIARLATTQAERLLDRDARSDADRAKAVVVYGGMLHDDLDPPPDRAKWSYAPALDAKTGGKLVAVDLVVPEFIVDDATWRAFPWFARYDRARLGAKTTLFRVGDRSFVLVFPETRR